MGAKAEIKVVEQKILDIYKIRKPVKYILVDIENVNIKPAEYSLKLSNNKFLPISRFAPTIRDLAFVVKNNIKPDEVTKTIKSIDDKILLVELFDEFLLDDDKKNIAFHIWLQDMTKPMRDMEVSDLINKIIKNIVEKYQAKLRSRK